MPEPFRVAIVPGVNPGRWVRTFEERTRTPLEVLPVPETEQLAVLRDGRATMGFVRGAVDRHREGLHLIPLYDEVAVVVVPRGHWVDGLDEVTEADLAEEHRWSYPHPELDARHVVEAVAAGTGVLVAPMSVARLHHRKDVVSVPVADLPRTPVGLAWSTGTEDERVDVFVGVVRGRTARSSRS